MPDDLGAHLRNLPPVARELLKADDEAADEGGEETVLERGETVLRLYRRGKSEQLRVVLDEFCGQCFATLRVWFRDPEDREVYRPTGRGVTVRRREFPQVLSALHEVARRLEIEDTAPPGQ